MDDEFNTLAGFRVSEVLDRWPQTIPIFLRHHMSCVGCEMAKFETLADALEIYHLPQKSFIAELKVAINALG